MILNAIFCRCPCYQIKLTQRKTGKGMSLESFEGLPLGDLVIAVKKEIQVLHGKARKLERSAKQITEVMSKLESVNPIFKNTFSKC